VLAAGGDEDFEIPAFLRKQEDVVRPTPAPVEDSCTPEQLLAKFNELSLTTTEFADITYALSNLASQERITRQSFVQIASRADREAFWACLLRWLSTSVPGMVALTRHAQRLLQAQLARVEPAFADEVEAKLAEAFPFISVSSWGGSPATQKPSLMSRFKKMVTGA